MALTENEYIVLSNRRTGKKPGESWLQILHRWLVRCPKCNEIWVVVGAHENDQYVCKNCGHEFAIRLSHESTHNQIAAHENPIKFYQESKQCHIKVQC